MIGGYLAVAFVAALLAFTLGNALAHRSQRNRDGAAAAAVCPVCAATTGPARRLSTAIARVRTIEWSGNGYPTRDDGRDADPVDDANAIIRAAVDRVHRLRFLEDRRKG